MSFSGSYSATKVVYDVLSFAAPYSAEASTLQLPAGTAAAGNVSLSLFPRDQVQSRALGS